jgi:Co/Zn/Cd efflux system component
VLFRSRIFSPQPIHYLEAMIVAAIGLAVNVVCAIILAERMITTTTSIMIIRIIMTSTLSQRMCM